jgi:hypothetical protein
MEENIQDAIASEEINPVEDGQVFESDQAGAGAEAEEFELFDYTQFADNKVKLQVNGEEVVVPLAEAIAGYQRQADYTRKTQELSEQRKQIQFAAALQEALDKDPVTTLQQLQEIYGVAQSDAISDDWDWEIEEPETAKYRQLEARIAAFEEEKAMQELQRTIDSLEKRYGDAFQADEVVARALAEGTTDLEATFKKIAFDKVYEEAITNKKVKAEEQARTQAKREAQVVSSSTAAAKTSAPISPAPTSVFEAFERAKKAHGL